MDRLIAEKLFGMYVYHYDKDRAEHCYWCLMNADCSPVVFGWDEGLRSTEAQAWADVPKYSTNIAHAWEVVEKMKSLGHALFQLQQWSDGWVATFDHRKPGCADTAPLAICTAALAAQSGDQQ